jgi:hypothetical protein
MIKVFKMTKRKVETLLKEYKTIKGALDFMENQNNHNYILYAIKRNRVIAFQSFVPKKKFFEKLFDNYSHL